MSDEKPEYYKLPIIVDIGSWEVKAGFSGEENPKVTFNDYIGEPKYNKILRTFNNEQEHELNENFIGEDCDKLMGIIKLRYPVKQGIFQNDNDILSIFNHIYKKLEINPQEIKEHPILITEPLLNPYSNRERIASTLFENLGASALFFASQPILSLFSTSNTSGVILESGHDITQCCVVFEGYSIPCSYERFNYGGSDVSEYLKGLLKKRGYNFYNSTEYRILNKIKEKLCFFFVGNVKQDIKETKKSMNKNLLNYYLPDGTIIPIGEERLLATDILLHPEYIGKEFLGFPDIIINAVNKIDMQLKPKLYDNILLSGGNTGFSGLSDILNSELKKKININMKINLETSEKPQYSCWFGGNIISTLEIFKKMWVTKSEWDEKGNNIIHTKTI